MDVLHGLLNEAATFGDYEHFKGRTSDRILAHEVKTTNTKGTKETIKALGVLGITKYDIIGYGYGDWEDKRGDTIFSSDILRQFRIGR